MKIVKWLVDSGLLAIIIAVLGAAFLYWLFGGDFIWRRL